MSVKRIYLKVYVIYKDSKGRVLLSPGLQVRYQSFSMFAFNAVALRRLFNVLTSPPYVYPSLNLFGVSSQPLAFGLSYLYELPDALRVAVLERTDFHDLHFFFFDEYELVVIKLRDEFFLSDLGVDLLREEEVTARNEENPKNVVFFL